MTKIHWVETQVTIKVYHNGIADEELLTQAQLAAEYLTGLLAHSVGLSLCIDDQDVAVHTSPFKVE